MNRVPGVLLALRVACALLLSSTIAYAHEVRPAVADVTVSAERVDIELSLTAESLVAGIDLTEIEDTNDAPEAEGYDALRALSEADMAARLTEAWPGIAAGFSVEVGGSSFPLNLQSVEVVPAEDLELPRDTIVMLSADLPSGTAPVRFGWISEYGPLVVRQGDAETGYSGFLTGGELSAPLPREGSAQVSVWAAFVDYIGIGFEHIIPKGLDHILFVLGLFFFSLALKPLVFQITAFTLAHTVTLALAVLGIVSIPASVVEPLIAASIVYVAVENIIGGQIGWRRTAVVFAFGLLHGLGFASVLGDIGLDPTRFITGLIGFNIGVELGQLAVIAAALVLVGLPFGKKDWYRRIIAIPASVAIAAVGAYWAVERVFF